MSLQINTGDFNVVYAQINDSCAIKRLRYTYFNISFVSCNYTAIQLPCRLLA